NQSNNTVSLNDEVGGVDPIVIDLDNDGIEIVQSVTSNQFDMNPEGTATPTNWLSGADGFLALDINGNGQVDNITELFSEYFALGGNSGLEALRTLDENEDGIIDQNDSQFANLQIWQDKNQDGISSADELSSLADHGVESFDLNVTQTNERLLDSTLLSKGIVGMRDGTTKGFAEVSFAVENNLVDSEGLITLIVDDTTGSDLTIGSSKNYQDDEIASFSDEIEFLNVLGADQSAREATVGSLTWAQIASLSPDQLKLLHDNNLLDNLNVDGVDNPEKILNAITGTDIVSEQELLASFAVKIDGAGFADKPVKLLLDNDRGNFTGDAAAVESSELA
ncbi:MAG: hypothetical protein ABGX32_06525, partial [Methylococcales bacterium]